jgi:glutathione S-transferase
MRLYHNPLSSSARRALMTAIHLGVKFESVIIDLSKPEHRRQLEQVNPNAKVPVLVDGDFVLWESYAIMQYLADRTPGQTVLPKEARARAEVNRWMFWGASHFAPAIGILGWENWMKGLVGAGAPDPQEVERGEMEVAKYAPILDTHLADRDWLCGDDVTLADLALAPVLMVTDLARLPIRQYTNIQAWYARVRELDAWQRTSL